MKKTVLRFVLGGIAYFLVEVIWRTALGRAQAAHPIMMIPAGTVLALTCFLDDRRLNIFLNALIGALTIVAFELVIGLTALKLYDVYLWYYGTRSFMGVICLRWSFAWYGICFGGIFVKQLWRREYFFSDWKDLRNWKNWKTWKLWNRSNDPIDLNDSHDKR